MPHPVPPAVVRLLSAALGPAGPSDADLLGRFVAARDEAAFELLVWRHAGAVRRVCHMVLRDHHAAEDAAQATFLVLARKAGTVREADAVGGWLLRVAHRVAVRAKRRGPPTPGPLPDRVPAPPTAVPDAELAGLVHEELARLPERERLPVVLCFFEGLSHAEAARRLGWPTGTVSGRLARAKDSLRVRLTRRGVALPATWVVAGTVGPGFAANTARAAAAFAAGRAVGVGASATALQLAKGTVMAMTVAKLQWVAGVAAVAGAVALGGTWVVGQGPGGPPKAGPPAVAVKDAPAAKPAGRVADFRQRQRSENNLTQIMLAIHKYHDRHGYLPADIRDKDGKPLLSWRVAILPFIEQDAAIPSFKLDEPWDSDHNKKLLRYMPGCYKLRADEKFVTDTPYQVFAGPGTPFDPAFRVTEREVPPGVVPADEADAKRFDRIRTRARLLDCTDGTGSILGVVEGGPPVPWTKPADIPYDPNKPVPHVGWPFTNVIHAATMSGHVHFLTPDLDKSPDYRLLIEMANGKYTDPDPLKAVLTVGSPEDEQNFREIQDKNARLIAEVRKRSTEQADLIRALNDAASDFTKLRRLQNGLEDMVQKLNKENADLRDELQPPGERKLNVLVPEPKRP